MRVSYAIVFVSDMSRSVSFYRDVLGLALKFETPHWSEFATGDATLALHLTNGRAASRVGNEAGSCRPGLAVPNLSDFHERMKRHQVRCTQEPKDVFGSRIAQYLDPDGLTISVAEEGAKV